MPDQAISAVQLPPERRPKNAGPRQAANRLSPLTQALDLKSRAYADALAKRTPVHIRAALMRAWVDLQEITMALRGQGKPKPVEARNATVKRKVASVTPIARVNDAVDKPAT